MGLPGGAFAQAGPPGAPGAPGPGATPSAELRATLEAVRRQAQRESAAALSPDHRTRVAAIVAQVTAGALDPRSAAHQIDALLTPAEANAVLGVATSLRAGAGMPGGGPPPGRRDAGPPPDGGPPPDMGPPPDGGPPGEGPPGGRGGWGGRHAPSAGGVLLRLSVTPEQMRALRSAGRPAAGAGPSPAP